jgi:predicted DNA-binding ribbon-helix-helix protein
MSVPATQSSTEKLKISVVTKRSIVIAGRTTSISLEDTFWKALREIAGNLQITLSSLVASIDSERQHGNLSSAIRLFILDYYQKKSVGAETPK